MQRIELILDDRPVTEEFLQRTSDLDLAMRAGCLIDVIYDTKKMCVISRTHYPVSIMRHTDGRPLCLIQVLKKAR